MNKWNYVRNPNSSGFDIPIFWRNEFPVGNSIGYSSPMEHYKPNKYKPMYLRSEQTTLQVTIGFNPPFS